MLETELSQKEKNKRRKTWRNIGLRKKKEVKSIFYENSKIFPVYTVPVSQRLWIIMNHITNHTAGSFMFQ